MTKPSSRVHQRARADEEDPLPQPHVAVGARVGAVLVLPLDRDVAADRQGAQGIFGFAALGGPDRGAHAERKFVDPHPRELADRKMAELMDEDEQPEDENRDNDLKDNTHRTQHIPIHIKSPEYGGATIIVFLPPRAIFRRITGACSTPRQARARHPPPRAPLPVCKAHRHYRKNSPICTRRTARCRGI